MTSLMAGNYNSYARKSKKMRLGCCRFKLDVIFIIQLGIHALLETLINSLLDTNQASTHIIELPQ